MPHPSLNHALAAAVERRRALLSEGQTEAVRLFDGDGDGVPGLVIERLGPALIVQLHLGRLDAEEAEVRAAVGALMREIGWRGAYRKYFPRDRTRLSPVLDQANRSSEPWVGEPVEAEITVRERGRMFLVHPFDGFATGLFLDHRDRRDTVAAIAHGKRVLNAFSYTCAFGVAAGLGGAAQVVNVDISKRYLEWGKRNLTLNGLALETQRFICSDVLDYYGRARRQRVDFDVVILDPPTFARTGKGNRVFNVADQLDELLGGALSILRNPGVVALSTNHERLTGSVLLASARSATAKAGRRLICHQPQRNSVDFPSHRHASRAVILEIG